MVNESVVINVINVIIVVISSIIFFIIMVNVIESIILGINMTVFWVNKILEDCVFFGGYWDKIYDCYDDIELEVFFLFVILFLGIFIIFMILKGMRISKFFFI